MYGLPQHKAFLFLIIEKYLADLQLGSIDIEEAIVDGSDDCGIMGLRTASNNIISGNTFVNNSIGVEVDRFSHTNTFFLNRSTIPMKSPASQTIMHGSPPPGLPVLGRDITGPIGNSWAGYTSADSMAMGSGIRLTR